MRKLNNKNKLFILLFSLIIIGIIGIFIYSMRMTGKFDKSTAIYSISTNSVVFNNDSILLDTKQGGNILKNWDNSYYYVGFDDKTYDLGNRTVVYEKAIEELYIFGDNYFVSENGNVSKNTDQTMISNTNASSFYKLDDRVYLIVSKDIYLNRYAVNKELIKDREIVENVGVIRINRKQIGKLAFTGQEQINGVEYQQAQQIIEDDLIRDSKENNTHTISE